MNTYLQSLLLALDSIGVVPRLMRSRRSPTSAVRARTNQHHALRRRKQKSMAKRIDFGGGTCIRRPVIMKKRRAILEGSRKPVNRIERRIRVLQWLVPNGDTAELGGLFQEAADYIACLLRQVKVMKIMVQVLTMEDSDG